MVLPPYSGSNGVSSLSTGTYQPNMGISKDNYVSPPGVVYPFTFKGGKRRRTMKKSKKNRSKKNRSRK